MSSWKKKINQTTPSSSIPSTLVTLFFVCLFYIRFGESSVLTEMEKPGKTKLIVDNILLTKFGNPLYFVNLFCQFILMNYKHIIV